MTNLQRVFFLFFCLSPSLLVAQSKWYLNQGFVCTIDTQWLRHQTTFGDHESISFKGVGNRDSGLYLMVTNQKDYSGKVWSESELDSILDLSINMLKSRADTSVKFETVRKIKYKDYIGFSLIGNTVYPEKLSMSVIYLREFRKEVNIDVYSTSTLKGTNESGIEQQFHQVRVHRFIDSIQYFGKEFREEQTNLLKSKYKITVDSLPFLFLMVRVL